MTNYFSLEGLEKLKAELKERESVTRGEIAARITDAKQLGDLSENAEYSEAREAQGMNEMRIEELKEILKNAQVMTSHQKSKVVVVGSTVMVSNGKMDRKFVIVGPAESNPAEGFISDETPLGMALMGHSKGDEISVKTPGGIMKWKILEVK